MNNRTFFGIVVAASLAVAFWMQGDSCAAAYPDLKTSWSVTKGCSVNVAGIWLPSYRVVPVTVE